MKEEQVQAHGSEFKHERTKNVSVAPQLRYQEGGGDVAPWTYSFTIFFAGPFRSGKRMKYIPDGNCSSEIIAWVETIVP